MKKLVVLGSNGNITNREIIESAKKQGIYTIVTDYFPPEKSEVKRLADEYWMISTTDFDALEAKCREVGVSGFHGGTDFAQDVALEMTSRLGLPCYCDKETWHYSRNKADFKKKCKEHGVPVATDYYLSDEPTEEELDAVQFPVIVKPSDRSGNVGFSYCYNKEDLRKAYAFAKSLAENDTVVIEKLLVGREYGAFYAVADGEARLLNFWSMLSEPGMPENCYSISTTVTDNLENYLENVHPQVLSLLKDVGCRDGVVWIEFMADENGQLNALELGHRLSGEMLWMPLTTVTGFDSVAWMVNYAVNGHNDVSKLPQSQQKHLKECACGYILWSAKEGNVDKIIGTDIIRNTEGMTLHMTTAEGEHIDAYRYCAIITFAAKDCEEMCEKIRFVNDTVQILDTNGEDLLIRYDQYSLLNKLYEDGHRGA